MDPVAAIATMRDASLPYEERWEAADALSGWIVNGGYVPAGEKLVALVVEYRAVLNGSPVEPIVERRQ